LATLFLRGAPAAVSADLAQPLAVVTYWQGFGTRLWIALSAAIAVAAIGYFLVLRACSREDVSAPSMASIIALCALSCAIALGFPVLFSSDVYAYAAYGDMALHGMDPYGHIRAAFHDRLFDAALWQWGDPLPVAVYGPLFVGIARDAVLIFRAHAVSAPLWALRVLSCLALIACAPLAYLAFGEFSKRIRITAAAGITLNPMAIWASAEGHNDALLLAIVLLGFALIARARFVIGAAVVALAALVKAPALAAAVGAIAASRHDRRRFAKVVSGAALGAVIVLIVSGPLVLGIGSRLIPGGHYAPQFSVQAALALALPVRIAAIAGAAIAGAFIITGGLQMLRNNGEGSLLVALGAWLAIPNPYPWYALWILPIAFVAWKTPAAYALIAASLLAVIRYYPDAFTDVSGWTAVGLVACTTGIPLLIFSAGTIRAYRVRRENQRTAPSFAPLHSR